MKILGLLILVVFLVSCGTNTDIKSTDNYSQTGTQDTNSGANLSNNNDTQMASKQTQGLENGDIVAVMKTTNGTIKIKLFTDLVPVTTTNFIGLAKQGYYNDVTFHRVIKDFMIQGGDPDGTGMGGKSIYGEKFDDEFSAELSNIPYSISMANAGANTNGSQFFINQGNNTFLDFDKEPLTSKHSVFGQVVEGTGTVDAISKVKTDSVNNKPEKDVKIISVDIKQYENGQLKDYNFDLDAKIKEIEADKKAKAEAKKTKAVESGDTVGVHYTGTFENGEKFDSSLDRGEPISFQVGAGQMIKGFDNAVVGMKIGDKKSLKLAPSEAYGEYDKNNKQIIEKAQLQSFVDAGIKLEVGAVLPTQVGNLSIIAVDDKTVTVDGNHPMAGKTLNFDIELVDIK
ncbi:MAG: peptidylprolyl isomerase [Candidatus Gracilibacteria bacterium]|nr:peptidylprolyl isomerase [Candidatus Gracilibacteria bacterium]